MASKAFTGLVVAFWLVMMAALVRVEIFPSPSQLLPVPVNQVLRKLFDNSDTQILKVLYQGKEIGLATIEIMPLASPVAKPGTPFAGRPGGYQVKAGVNLNLDVFGTPSKFHLGTDSRFDKRYEIMNYRVSTKVGASEVEINGTNATKEITMTYDVGDGKQTRHFGYDQLSSPGGWEALGLPGLSGLASFALPVSTSGSAGNAAALRPVIHAYDDHLTLGGISQHAFLADCRSELNPAFWAKIWIDDQGSVLVVETSVGIAMRSSAIDSVADKIAVTVTPSRTRPLQ